VWACGFVVCCVLVWFDLCVSVFLYYVYFVLVCGIMFIVCVCCVCVCVCVCGVSLWLCVGLPVCDFV